MKETMKETLKRVINKMLLSRKGITWIIAEYLLVSHYSLIAQKYIIETNDVIILVILEIVCLASLGIIAFEKVKIELKK